MEFCCKIQLLFLGLGVTAIGGTDAASTDAVIDYHSTESGSVDCAKFMHSGELAITLLLLILLLLLLSEVLLLTSLVRCALTQ